MFLRAKASRYAFYGVIIAALGVIFATLLVSYVMLGEVSLQGVILGQNNNIALWVLDGMPFVFAAWGQHASEKMVDAASLLVPGKTPSRRTALGQLALTSQSKSDFLSKTEAAAKLTLEQIPFNRQDGLEGSAARVTQRAPMATRGLHEQARRRRGLITKYSSKRPLRLLLAEDSAVNREVFTATLNKMGYTPDVAANGHEALAAAMNTHYDLILMDVHMPELDGLSALAALRALPSAAAQTPVIILTAGLSEEERGRCRALGVQEIVFKPMDPALLDQAITRAVKTPSLEEAASNPEFIDLFL